MPDIEIKLDRDALLKGKDPQLEAALQHIKNQIIDFGWKLIDRYQQTFYKTKSLPQEFIYRQLIADE